MTLLSNLINQNSAAYHFWPDDISLLDAALFQANRIQGHKQVTDLYLLGLCQAHGGTFVTLDTRLSSQALVNPRPDLIRLLTP